VDRDAAEALSATRAKVGSVTGDQHVAAQANGRRQNQLILVRQLGDRRDRCGPGSHWMNRNPLQESIKRGHGGWLLQLEVPARFGKDAHVGHAVVATCGAHKAPGVGGEVRGVRIATNRPVYHRMKCGE
jgi:hypothetical protein